MKKIFNIAVLLFCVIAFATCSNEESVPNQTNESVAERFAVCKEAAVFHSEGLDFAYNKFNEIRKVEGLNFLRTISKEKKLILINASVTEFISQKQIVSNLAVLDKKIHLMQFEEVSMNQEHLRSENGLEYSPDDIKLLSFFDSVVDKVTDISAVVPAIESAIRSEEFASFPEEEQNALLMMFAVYEDSSSYWDKNLDNWQNLLGEENILRSSVTDQVANIDIEGSTIWKSDAAGAIGGGIGGAVGGAIGGALIGALAGGVGAGPGAVVGAIGGAVSGAISTAIGCSIYAWLVPSSSQSNDQLTFSAQELLNNIVKNTD
ncbi:MAG: hypothetical protein LBO74_15655 [Candidatus Symbiothrix sp.]|jgi:hypothetical protein|nr:hypothetical protein [Candidatus Symbiothrix sp.]